VLRMPPRSAHLGEAFAALDLPASLFATDGTYVYVNPPGLQLLAKALDDVVGRTYLDVFPELSGHPFQAAFERVASGASQLERLEFEYEQLWSRQRIYPAMGQVVVVWEDITAQKAAERQVAESLARAAQSERHFRTMIEGMPQLAWWAKPDGFIDYYNPRWYEYTGTTPSSMEGWGWQAVHDPEVLPSVMTRWQECIATGQPFEMEFPLRRHDGVPRWFLTRVMPMHDDSGRLVRWVGINTDIDDQKTSLMRVTETLESMGDAFVLLDRQWRIVMVNRNQERISQTSREQILGRVFWEVFPAAADPASKYWTEYHRVMDERIDLHFEEHDAPLDSWSEVDAFPSRDGGIAVFFRDISERKRVEQAREDLLVAEQAARSLAETASRAKDEFLAMLGHELRNPLSPILTAVALLRQKPGERNDRALDAVERQVRHMMRLVEDLLDVSRVAQGKIALRRQRVVIADVIADSIELAAPLIEQRQHKLTCAVDRGLTVDGDPERLVQVFSNLLSNAARYTQPRGTIAVSAAYDAGEIAVRVRDNGTGIAPSLLPRVFEMFVQAPQDSDRRQGGLGLGLALVRSLVALHGGRVEAVSDGEGRGSEFTVRLPADVSVLASRAGDASAEVLAPPQPVDRRRQRVVLLVDDNEDAASMLGELLTELGCDVHIALDGSQALELATTIVPDVALLDIGLPVMDGHELARRLRAMPSWHAVRLVALTGYGLEEDRRRSLAAGFHRHLVKPIDLVAVKQALFAEEDADLDGDPRRS